MHYFALHNTQSLKYILQLNISKFIIPIIGFEVGSYLYSFRNVIVFDLCKTGLSYKLHVYFENKSIYHMEETIETFHDTLIWNRTNFSDLSKHEMYAIHIWFESICSLLKNVFHTINVNEFKHCIYNFESNKRFMRVIQRCTPLTQYTLQKYHKKIKNRIAQRKHFHIWKEWYFNPNNKNGFIKKLSGINNI